MDVGRGALYGLIGPNGAGKTTVFNLLTGVYDPTEGDILLEGRQIGGRQPFEIAKLGMTRTFQNIRLFSDMTVLENVMAARHLRSRQTLADAVLGTPRHHARRARDPARAMELLKIFDLDGLADENATSLPYGSQRRLEIARALATEPRVLLLDEPAAGMNPQESQDLMGLIRWIRDEFALTVAPRRAQHEGRDGHLRNRSRSSTTARRLRSARRPRFRRIQTSSRPILAPASPALGTDPQGRARGCVLRRDSRAARRLDRGPRRRGRHADWRERRRQVHDASCDHGPAGAADRAHRARRRRTSPARRRTRSSRAVCRWFPKAVACSGTSPCSRTSRWARTWRPDKRAHQARTSSAVSRSFPRLKERIKQRAGTLSGGEQQMLAIARALMSRPRVLLLDEPSLGLAPIVCQTIFATIDEIKAAGTTVLLVEQNARAALKHSDRAYVLETGSIILERHGVRRRQRRSGPRGVPGGMRHRQVGS